MEASAPGRARRGWRRSRAAGSPLSRAAVVLVFSALVLRAPPSVGYLAQLPRGIHLTQESMKIVGSPNFPVKVYVMLHQKSPHVLCVTQRLRNSELIDPSFQWHGPKGKIISENSTAQVTSTGSLVLQNFEESMSGVYTCFLEYKTTVEEVVKNLQLKYVIYAYREPRYYYQFTARYHAAPCNSIYNVSFEKKLLQILSKLVLDLSCQVFLLKSECHRVKMQRAGLQNELFFTFSVSSLDTAKGPKPCADHSCESSKRLSKAKNLIERFFNQQVEVLGRRAEPLPEIYYIEGTLQMVWINRCFPGYGMNILKHPKCPDCCVICSPGSYNSRDGIHCLQCNSSLVFGAKACL
ncbi:zona pellucida-binding protein 1 [Physeter macrocephalus]|uniref:Zona pellucida-binding protein 1 n=1 Tax=Physeter macrocephalus TaxID=9755 RepID=A0A2Y9S3U9_PHYMC|nr:zona pellucida-binding protein 1 [Physeter catodon]|eukprot:XP_023970840.1 zona pellucida-binding protein 1 [Physeter catodon]